MTSALGWLFDAGLYAPHGTCFLWEPTLLAAILAGKVATALACLGTAGILLRLLQLRRVDRAGRRARLWLSGLLTMTGIGYLVMAATIFWPVYRLQAVWNGLTALVALAALLSLPSAVLAATRERDGGGHAG